ncbi:type II secretion system protein GspL [Thiomonas intermedia]|uniref:type II secretion system protein GspL n=1 Tax=Thiomonas intermedia TaxID=926 RepID=UPI0009A51316|nr:type II secretion system protein GspL [Thiomonas intermedia]
MQTLVLRLPPLASAHPLPELEYVLLSANGKLQSVGREQVALLPRGARVIAVVDVLDASVMAVTLPAMPPTRLQAALSGALEDRLLQDAGQLHLAVGPLSEDGAVSLACAVQKTAMQQVIADLTQAGQEPEQIVPEAALLAPGDALLQTSEQGPRLLWRDLQGEAAWLPLILAADAAAPQALPLPVTPEHLWVQDQAQPQLGWLDLPPELTPATLNDAGWMARAAQSPWNLRQFDLAPKHALSRGWAGVREQLATPAWRRAGALAGLLAALQLVGMNAAAFKLSRQEQALRQKLDVTAAEALPGVPAILDAKLQVQRALNDARLRTGRPGDGDLDVLMGRATAVVPPGVVPTALTFSPGQLQLSLPGDAAAQAAARCAPAGLSCVAQGDVLSVTGAAP